MLCIYRSKANFAENMANNVKKESKSARIGSQTKATYGMPDE